MIDDAHPTFGDMRLPADRPKNKPAANGLQRAPIPSSLSAASNYRTARDRNQIRTSDVWDGWAWVRSSHEVFQAALISVGC
jgi:hypothetical protein